MGESTSPLALRQVIPIEFLPPGCFRLDRFFQLQTLLTKNLGDMRLIRMPCIWQLTNLSSIETTLFFAQAILSKP